MKRFLALLLALVMVLGLGACAFDIGDNSGFSGSKTPASSNTPVATPDNNDTPVVTPANPKELSEEVLKGTWAATVNIKELATVLAAALVGSEDERLMAIFFDKLPANLTVETLLVADETNLYEVAEVEEMEAFMLNLMDIYTAETLREICQEMGMSEEEALWNAGCNSFEEVAEQLKENVRQAFGEDDDSEIRNGYAFWTRGSWYIEGNKVYTSDEEVYFVYDGTYLTMFNEELEIPMRYTYISNKTDY